MPPIIDIPLWHTFIKEAILSICIRKIFALHLRMRAKVINIKTRKPVFTKTLVTRDEFFDMADAVKDTLAELRNIDISTAVKILNEMKFCACFDYKFRQDIYPELEELFYDLYARSRT